MITYKNNELKSKIILILLHHICVFNLSLRNTSSYQINRIQETKFIFILLYKIPIIFIILKIFVVKVCN